MKTVNEKLAMLRRRKIELEASEQSCQTLLAMKVCNREILDLLEQKRNG